MDIQGVAGRYEKDEEQDPDDDCHLLPRSATRCSCGRVFYPYAKQKRRDPFSDLMGRVVLLDAAFAIPPSLPPTESRMPAGAICRGT
jgi:hypothetical protein